MLVTAAPCAIKGAALDCYGGCHLRGEDTERKGEQLEGEGASPLLASDARVLPT